MGMVVEPDTGLQYGSVIEHNIVVDASQFENRMVKVNIRNTSGDPAFDLRSFQTSLEQAYKAKGYEPVGGDEEFGILIDINVMYSGQVSRNRIGSFAFLGGAGGGIAGAAIGDSNVATAAGALSGVALGTILGSYVTEDTYIVIADVTLGVIDVERGERETTIVFSASQKEERREKSGFKSFRERVNTGIAVYAGGQNISQSRISSGVRQRSLIILSDVICNIPPQIRAPRRFKWIPG